METEAFSILYLTSNMDNKHKSLLLLSDIDGWEDCEWLDLYKENLKAFKSVDYKDVLNLAGISSNLDKSKRHELLVNGGIESCIQSLSSSDKRYSHVMGFSIGATIAWYYTDLSKLDFDSIVCVSGTRLRFCEEKHSKNVSMIFGSQDSFKPTSQWFFKMGIHVLILPDHNHEFYKEQSSVDIIMKALDI